MRWAHRGESKGDAMLGRSWIAGLMMFGAALAQGRTHHVPQDYSSIQRALDATSEGDTVLCAPGYYSGIRENSNVVLPRDHAITLLGAGYDGGEYSVIDCLGDGRGFIVPTACQGHVIKGFNVKNG